MKYLILFLFLFYFNNNCQDKSLKGKVISSDNEKPLSSATILVKGTAFGTTTDINGEFTLTGITDSAEIIISYLGYYPRSINISTKQTSEILVKLDPKIISSQTVLVTGVIGKEGVTPSAFSLIKRTDIENNYIQQDIPEFLNSFPSTTVYSENGNGLGYNYLSIRGFDQRRISVSINGIPQNDPEDHNVYWLDFPDLLASTEMIQVQRGAGSGAIGYPAIGGSINLITSSVENQPSSNLSVYYGAFNTRKYSAAFSSGIINNKYSLSARLSKTISDGYRDYSWIDFNSYHVSAVRFDDNLTTQINLFGGPVADGLAYNGIAKFAVKDKNARKDNYSYWESDGQSYMNQVRRRKEEIENYSQPHYELLNELNITNNISINSALFLVTGSGFFDYDGSWTIYEDDYFRLRRNGIDSLNVPTNAIIRAQVDNKQWGWIPRISIKYPAGELIGGAEIRVHRSLHWGRINYAENIPAGVDENYKYYQYKGANDIFNFFLHNTYNLNEQINIMAEAQLAYHKYRLYEEMYVGNDFIVDGLYFNPKFGINYKISPAQSVYFSFARVTREPRLKNYYDAAESSYGEIPQFNQLPDGSYDFNNPLVKPETMNDFEIGSSIINKKFNINLNIFYMLFSNEIVKNGQIDRFGEPVTGNADRTIHTGAELSLNINPVESLEIILNSTFSKNYIDKGNSFIKYESLSSGNDTISFIDISGNRIGGFPDFIFNGILRFKNSGFFCSLNAKYTGKFYSDNYDKNLSSYLAEFPAFADYSDNVVDAYFVTDLFASYQLVNMGYFTSIKIFAQVNNIFNNLYAAYAIGKEFFPAAGTGYYVGIQAGF